MKKIKKATPRELEIALYINEMYFGLAFTY